MRERWVLVSIIVLQLVFIGWIIHRYETDLGEKAFRVTGGVKRKQYTAAEVRQLIKALPDYQEDSLVIYEDGRVVSQVPEINGGLQHIYNSPDQLNALKQTALDENLPLGFVIYRNVIPYYIQEHGDRRQKKSQ